MIKAFTTLGLSFLLTSFQFFHRAECFPKNSLSFPADAKSSSGLSKAEYDTVLDEFEAVMTLETSRVDNGALLVIERKWDNSEVNAMAYQSGNYRYVSMFGGLARHPNTTTDVLRLVACHELGHHIGGAPKKASGGIWGWGGASWASNEGQSDYYASMKCFRRLVIEGRKNNLAVAGPDLSIFPANEVQYAKNECAKSFSDSLDQEICVRASMGGFSIGLLFSSFSSNGPVISLKTPNPRVVSSTDDNHPQSQCRTDTYFQGAVCEVSYRNDVSTSDANFGTCNRKDNHTRGLRPLCWFKPSRT